MSRWIPLLFLLCVLPPLRALDLASLHQDQDVAGFSCQALYEDGRGQVMGARLLAPNGFVLDLLTIESVPQAFWWIRTAPTDSRGEPHACEHLLLGKGRRGRAVAALEDMRLATSTAYTDQLHTCYQFHTTAGLSTFLELFEAKLMALLHPDFLDEEIRREVCHYDVAEDDAGQLSLVEKGTVYTEMVSSFEKPWYWGSEAMAKLVYGPEHPLYHNAGGDPRAMWDMEPQDLWDFHRNSHFPANMGAIVSLPSSANLDSTLTALSAVLQRCDLPAPRVVPAGIGAEPLAAPRPAETGTRVRAPYPSPRPEDPATLSLQWPADLQLTPLDDQLLQLFMQAFAGGETSTLYDKLVNSETRVLDLGVQSVWGSRERRPGHSIAIGLSGLRPAGLDDAAVDQVLAVIQSSLQELAACAPGDTLLRSFNQRLAAIAQSERRQLREYLNTPPMFGHRGGNAGAWLNLLEQCEHDPGFRRSLVRADLARALDGLLAQSGNPWTTALARWRLLERAPYVVISAPSPVLQQEVLQDRAQRRGDFIANLMQRLGLNDEQLALAAYRDEFARRTAELEAASADDPLPGFLADPPMGMDEELDYSWEPPLFTARFPSMESATMGVALDLRQWPIDDIALLPLLTESLCDVGLVLGDTLDFAQMQQAMRREILGLSCRVEHS
ncbi:MAG: hypothetical protein KDC10_05300, partial [Calditrichaeota bacterium]|nr:hypothetical protein [Calditrichota bacterium]